MILERINLFDSLMSGDALKICAIPFLQNISDAFMTIPYGDNNACIRFFSIVISSPMLYLYLAIDARSSDLFDRRYTSGSSFNLRSFASFIEFSLSFFLGVLNMSDIFDASSG